MRIGFPRGVPAISVILPVHNAGSYLCEALTSLARQSEPDFEVIAVDDGSSDGSGRVLDEWAGKDPRFKVVHQPSSGIVTALNRAIDQAEAPLLARMDADDIAEPRRFELQLQRMASDPQLVALGSAVLVIDARGRPVKRMPRALSHEEIDAALLRGDGGALIHPAVMFRAATVRSLSSYRRSCEFKEDLDLFLRLAEVGRMANLPDSLLRYRVHFRSVNFTKGRKLDHRTRMIVREAHERRGLRFDEQLWSRNLRRGAWTSHLELAVTSLEFGDPEVSRYHAWMAWLKQPWSLQAVRTLRYVLARTRNLRTGGS